MKTPLLLLTGGLALPLAGVPVPDAVPRLHNFDLEQVRLLAGPFRDAQSRDLGYLLSLDPDRFLVMFRSTAGLPPDARAPKAYGGWESPTSEVRGHILGHYLSACALMYASTGDPRLRQRTDYLVAELAKCQRGLASVGFHRGYLSAFPESFFDRVDAQQDVWAPWYTMHKIMAGLLEVHLHTGNAQALEVLKGMAGWVKFRVDRLSPEQMQASLRTEHGGMAEVLANLSAVTGDPDDLRLAQAFNHHAVIDPLAQGEDRLDRLHANTQIPKIIGIAREFELTGNPVYRDIARFFWQEVALKRSYVIGGDSDDEHFFDVADFVKHLSPVTAETCNTYNMLRLTEHVFSWDRSAAVMDFYERGLYNQILGSQDPDTGMMTYFVPMESGRFKTYSTPENSFWCCVGTGMENHAKYGEEIYVHDDRSLYVNLFIPSELTWSERGLSLRQETRFPDEPGSRLAVRAPHPVSLALRIRQPEWCAGPVAVSVNGKPFPAPPDGAGYLVLDRTWRDGDAVELALPLALRAEPLPGNPATVALVFGPVVLAAELGSENLPDRHQEAVDQKDFVALPVPEVPRLAGDTASILAALRPVDGRPLTFRTAGIGRPRDLTFVPLYRLHHQRYAVYWQTDAPLAAAP
jgi:uncharacterized protein